MKQITKETVLKWWATVKDEDKKEKYYTLADIDNLREIEKMKKKLKKLENRILGKEKEYARNCDK